MSGKLIVLYGINHKIKESYAKRLVAYLKAMGKSAEYIKYPIYSVAPSGFYIDKVLKGKEKMNEEELQVWFLLNRLQYQPILKKKLKDTIIIAEDYSGTAIAWGAAKGCQETWITQLNQPITSPDISILLNTEQFLGSLENGIYGNNDLIESVRENLLNLARKHSWPIIDTKDGDEIIFRKLLNQIKPIIE